MYRSRRSTTIQLQLSGNSKFSSGFDAVIKLPLNDLEKERSDWRKEYKWIVSIQKHFFSSLPWTSIKLEIVWITPELDWHSKIKTPPSRAHIKWKRYRSFVRFFILYLKRNKLWPFNTKSIISFRHFQWNPRVKQSCGDFCPRTDSIYLKWTELIESNHWNNKTELLLSPNDVISIPTGRKPNM